MSAISRRSFLGGAAVGGVLAASRGRRPALAGGRPPNVVIVVLDTVRADHLGCYGYERQTTPSIDAFAARAVRYTRAKATAPWTLPSHASMFTGQYPFEHGAHRHPPRPEGGEAGQHPDLGTKAVSLPLAGGALTLAEVFGARGYATAGFSANSVFTTARYGIAQGFATYEVMEMDGLELNRYVRPWLEAHAREPFFLFVNYMDAHLPYNVTLREGVLDGPLCPMDCQELTRHLGEAVLTDPAQPRVKELARDLIGQYDMGVANADRAFGQLCRQLAHFEAMENTVVIVTSDHGEYFGEHKLTSHGNDVYEEVIAVPLLMRHPGVLGEETCEQLVSLAHVPSLVFAALGQDAELPPELAKHAPGEAVVLAEAHYARPGSIGGSAQRRRLHRVRFAAYADDRKYVASSDGRHELYDLAADPRETRSLSIAELHRAEAMQTALDTFRLKHGPGAAAVHERSRIPAPQLTREEIEAMRALGYLD